jgi:hypothetical protein
MKNIIHDFFVFIWAAVGESATKKNNGKIKCWKSFFFGRYIERPLFIFSVGNRVERKISDVRYDTFSDFIGERFCDKINY